MLREAPGVAGWASSSATVEAPTEKPPADAAPPARSSRWRRGATGELRVIVASVFPEVSELSFSRIEPLARLLP